MARILVLRAILRNAFLLIFSVLLYACLQPPVALAQHGGGHVGGGFSGGHFGGSGGHFGSPRASSPHVSPPHATPPFAHTPVSPFRFSTGPRFASGFAPGVVPIHYRFRTAPVQPLPPVYPFFGAPVFFVPPFYGWGWGWGFYGFNSCWWPNCGGYWGYNYGCNTIPFYGYGFGNSAFDNYSAPPPSTNYYEAPSYSYSEDRRDLPRLYLRDGTVYVVTDYWLVGNQLHFTVYDEGGGKPVERVIPFDDLDLQRSIDVNTHRGFRFVLRNEPLDQYLQDHPNDVPPDVPRPQND